MIGLGTIFSLLCLALTWKRGKKLRKLAVLDQLLTHWGRLLQWWFVLLEFHGHIWSGYCPLTYAISQVAWFKVRLK